MNYIKLVNQFWKLRRSKRITSKQTDLYFFLLHECNNRDWENPFECANVLIIASIDIKEPTLIDARNRLKQLGLIDFIGGKKNEASPIYTLSYLNNLSNNRGESIVEREVNAEVNDEHYRNKQNKTKRKKEGGAEAPDQKSFKEFSEKEFIDNISQFKEEFPYEIRNGFFKYWKEKNARGKMRFQLEKTWETKLRLEKWQLNQEKFSNGSHQQSLNGSGAKAGTSDARIAAAKNF